jgi:small-conductance mechanosensitive channel
MDLNAIIYILVVLAAAGIIIYAAGKYLTIDPVIKGIIIFVIIVIAVVFVARTLPAAIGSVDAPRGRQSQRCGL